MSRANCAVRLRCCCFCADCSAAVTFCSSEKFGEPMTVEKRRREQESVCGRRSLCKEGWLACRLRVGNQGIVGRFPVRDGTCCFPQRPEWLWGSPVILFGGYWELYSGVKRSALETDISFPYDTEVKMCGALPPPQHMSSWLVA